jgi:hypothetical protein
MGAGTGDRRLKTEDRGPRTEDRRRRTEDRRLKTEDRGQKTEDRRCCLLPRGLKPIFYEIFPLESDLGLCSVVNGIQV